MFDFFKSGWKRTVRLDDAEIFPTHASSQPNWVKGGVRHKDMPPEFHQRRAYSGPMHGTDLAFLAEQPVPTERLTGRSLYVGPFFRHYGHYIAESLHRLWAYMLDPDAFDHLLVLPQVPNPKFTPTSVADLPIYQRAALDYLGIPLSKIRLITKPLIAEHLTVPLQASLLGPNAKKPRGYIELLARHEASYFSHFRSDITRAPTKVFVSRSNFLPKGAVAGERYIEQLLAAEGFHIMRPETMGLTEQLHLYRNADLLIFSEGSAMHTIELLGPIKAQVVCLLRRPDTHKIWENALDGRVHHLAFFSQVAVQPTLGAGRDGKLAEDRALSLIDSKAFVNYMRASGFARLEGFDQDAFWRLEAADIARYMIETNMKFLIQHDLLAPQMQAFRTRLSEHPNPYLHNIA